MMEESQEQSTQQNSQVQSEPQMTEQTADTSPISSLGILGFDVKGLGGEESVEPTNTDVVAQEEQSSTEPVSESTESIETSREVSQDDQVSEDENTESEVLIKSPIYGEKGLKLKQEEQENSNNELSDNEGLDEKFNELYKSFGVSDSTELKTAVDFYKQKEKFDTISSEHSRFVEVLSSLPAELYAAVEKFSQGEASWRDSLKNIRSFDMTKDAESQNKKDIIDYYLPETISNEEWEEYIDPDGDKTVKKAVEAYFQIAKGKFEKEQRDIQTKAQRSIEEAQERQNAFNSSLKNTISALPKSLDGVDQMYLKKVEESLNGRGLVDMFYNEDGYTLKEDAALRFAMAQDGFELMRQLQHLTAVKAKNEERANLLSRGAESPTAKKQTNQGSGLSPEIERQIERIEGIFTKKTTF